MTPSVTTLCGPRQANLVLIACASSEGSGEPAHLAHTSNESRETFRQKARSLAPLNGWACAVKIYHDGMLEDTNSLDAAHVFYRNNVTFKCDKIPFKQSYDKKNLTLGSFHMKFMKVAKGSFHKFHMK